MNTHKYLVLELQRGSRFYFLNNNESDDDRLRVYYSLMQNYLGCNIGKIKFPDKKFSNIDFAEYDIRNFVRMMSVCNPNILPFTISPNVVPSAIENKGRGIYIDEFGHRIIEFGKECLYGDQIKRSFLGYSFSDYRKSINSISCQISGKRKELVDKFGYDTKAMSNAFLTLEVVKSLWKFGIPILNEQTRQFIIDIKNGEYKLDIAYGLYLHTRDVVENLDNLDSKYIIDTEIDTRKTNLFLKELLLDIYHHYKE